MIPPQLSVVIVSTRGGQPLTATIEAYQREDASLEVVVVSTAGDDALRGVRTRFPGMQVLQIDRPCALPRMRAAGLLAAHGSIVALTTDTCRPAPGWADAVRRAHQDGADVVGGAIENGSTSRLVDWAVFFCEYGRYMLPMRRGRSADLPAQNVSYGRAAVAPARRLLDRGVWETLVHWELDARGLRLEADPSIVVTMSRCDHVGPFLRERFHFARSFAGQRIAQSGAGRRFGFAAGAAFLPPLLLARLARHILPKKRALGRFVCSLPYLALFTCAWAAGECVGYATGPGDSASHIT